MKGMWDWDAGSILQQQEQAEIQDAKRQAMNKQRDERELSFIERALSAQQEEDEAAAAKREKDRIAERDAAISRALG